MADKKQVDEALEFLEGVDFVGYEEIDNDTMAIPFVRIAQAINSELNPKGPDFIQGLSQGDFFNTVNKKVYGDEIRAIILKFERIYIEWKPERGGFVGYHKQEDLEKIVADWTFGAMKTIKGNDLVEYYVYYLLIEGHEDEGVVIMSLASSNLKIAKQLNRMLKTHRLPNGNPAPPYALIFKFYSEQRSNDKGTWYGVDFSFDGYIDQEQYKIIKEERKMLPEKKVEYAQITDGNNQGSSEGANEESPY